MTVVVEQDLDTGDVTIHNGYNRTITLSDGQARTLTKFLLGALYEQDRALTRALTLQKVTSAYALSTPRVKRLQAVA